MNDSSLKSDIAGLTIYAACLALAGATTAVFPDALGATALLELSAAALVASLLTAAVRHSALAALFRDRDAAFSQGFLGICVNSGLYGLLSTHPRPEVMFLSFLLWSAVGLMQLHPLRVAILFVLNAGIYLNTFASTLFASNGDAEHAETVLMLLTSAVMAVFMSWRARNYTRIRREKNRLQADYAEQTEALAAAEARIHTLTIQDMDTIALKYPYFRSALVAQKTLADRSGHTFSIGLVDIDHYEEIRKHYGDVAARQLLREFADRTSKLVRKMDFLADAGEDYQPLGRVGKSLFGLVLPGTNLSGALHCVQRLHEAMEFRNIRTEAGPITVTLSIGVVEYKRDENVDEILADLSRALEKARLGNEEFAQIKERPRVIQPPIKAAASVEEMVLLDYKDYSRPMH